MWAQFSGKHERGLQAKVTSAARELDTSPDAGYHAPRIGALKNRNQVKKRTFRRRKAGVTIPFH